MELKKKQVKCDYLIEMLFYLSLKTLWTPFAAAQNGCQGFHIIVDKHDKLLASPKTFLVRSSYQKYFKSTEIKLFNLFCKTHCTPFQQLKIC